MVQERTFEAVVIVVTSGILMGCIAGYTALAVQFTQDISDCNRYTDGPDCNRVGSVCFWNVPNGSLSDATCNFRDQNATQAYCASDLPEDECEETPRCVFSNDECRHTEPWSSSLEGRFVAVVIGGTAMGALITGPILRVFKHSNILRAGGVLCILSTLVIAWAWNFPKAPTAEEPLYYLSDMRLYMTARFFQGLAKGMIGVAAPLFGAAVAPEENRERVLFFFQISMAVGAFFIATFGFMLDSITQVSYQQYWFQFVHAFLIFFAVLQIVCVSLAKPIDDGSAKPTDETPLLEAAQQKPTGKVAAAPDDSDDDSAYGLTVYLAFMAALMVAVGMQFSGINVIINFAPTLSENMGFAPLAGMMFLMFCNMIAAFLSLAVKATGIKTERMNQFGFAGTSTAALISGLASNPVLFPDHDSDFGYSLMVIGLALSLLAFQALVSPSFYVVVQRAFPKTWRAVGTGFAVAALNFVSLCLVWVYPWVVEKLTFHGDSRWGTSTVFYVFFFVSAGRAVGAFAFFKLKNE